MPIQPAAQSEAPFPSSELLGVSPHIASSNWIVSKFGGTSVSSRQKWEHIAAGIRSRQEQGFNSFVVHSAFAGVSDALEAVAHSGSGASSQAEHIIELHYEHAASMGLRDTLHNGLIDLEIAELRTLAKQAEEAPLKNEDIATLMGLGERMSTQLGAAFLNQAGIETHRIDARDWLQLAKTEHVEENHKAPSLLAGVCHFNPDTRLQESVSTFTCVVTQGFVARTAEGQNALLGRGGSDTSAAYFAAKLQAHRLEIWTDVPGMFSADPRIIPSARGLKALHYDEAQELAAMGSKVLHPHTLTPPQTYGIPVFIRSTSQPELEGTCIAPNPPGSAAPVKGIAFRQNLKLVSMENPAMWQQAGFLAKAFALFNQYGVSIDLISTSESTVTVSLDPLSNTTSNVLEKLIEELKTICRVSLLENCASVSLVGRNIRTMLHLLAPAMSVFAEHKIHLLSQAASDLNFTVVVDSDQGVRLTRKLHDAMIQSDTHNDTFGASWERLHESQDVNVVKPWWQIHRSTLLELMAERDCAYVYHADTIRERVAGLRSITSLDRALYAMKANPNKEVLQVVNDAGLSFECVSPGELTRLFELFPNIDRRTILYTPNFALREDYRFGLASGVRVTLDNLFPLRHWGDDFEGKEVFVRLDPGQGRGHHELVRTAGAQSKFGVPLFELDELETLTKRHNVRVSGIHAHSGSGIMDSENWHDVGYVLSAAAKRFPDVNIIDMGGGLGIPEKPGDRTLNVIDVDTALQRLKVDYPDYKLWMEPGRYVVAESGVLLARVTQTKGKGDVQYVGVATGMNSLIRPALYGAYHEIVNLSKLGQPATERYTVVGPNCETGDRLGLDRLLPPCDSGDVLLIANTGAYGYAMSSRYNLREPAVEIVI
ncbi:MAG: bifunctional aspartate kinase/diaminopimelate decarboxylase [Gammaproteobacteria bacterium]